MVNFNEKVNRGIGYSLNSQEFFIYRTGTIKEFDRIFGLKENFPEQDEKVFGKAEGAKSVQEENDLIEEAKRNIESCMNLLDTNACQLERAMDAIKLALMDIEDHKCELGDILTKLDDTLRKLK